MLSDWGEQNGAEPAEPLPLPAPAPGPHPALTEGPSPESEEAEGLASAKLVSTVEL